MLLSLAISSIRKNCSFDQLALANVIEGVMEEGPTTSASCPSEYYVVLISILPNTDPWYYVVLISILR